MYDNDDDYYSYRTIYSEDFTHVSFGMHGIINFENLKNVENLINIENSENIKNINGIENTKNKLNVENFENNDNLSFKSNHLLIHSEFCNEIKKDEIFHLENLAVVVSQTDEGAVNCAHIKPFQVLDHNPTVDLKIESDDNAINYSKFSNVAVENDDDSCINYFFTLPKNVDESVFMFAKNNETSNSNTKIGDAHLINLNEIEYKNAERYEAHCYLDSNEIDFLNDFSSHQKQNLVEINKINLTNSNLLDENVNLNDVNDRNNKQFVDSNTSIRFNNFLNTKRIKYKK